jgi:CheY-like chemotaxis protein
LPPALLAERRQISLACRAAALAPRLPWKIIMLTVLIADDEPHVVDLIRLTLEDERITVVDAFDGASALALAERLRPDLIFLDVHLPDISGLEVCARLRTDPRFAATKIVMLTAAAQESDVARGLAAGASHYLTKPFSPVRLLSLVESVVPQAPVWQRG